MSKTSRERIVSNWQPAWTKNIEIWTAKQIRKNEWRFDPIDGFQDLMQESKLLFLKLSKEYPVANNNVHFFALYKTSLSRMFIDKSRVAAKSIPIDRHAPAEEIAEKLSMQGTPNYGLVNLLLDEMPDELKLVLRALTTGRVRLMVDRPTTNFRHRENHNMRLKRRLKLDTPDPVGDLRRYFLNA